MPVGEEDKRTSRSGSQRLPHLKTLKWYEAFLPWNVKAALRPTSQPANAVNHTVACALTLVDLKRVP
jgi:hypothetical protein